MGSGAGFGGGFQTATSSNGTTFTLGMNQSRGLTGGERTALNTVFDRLTEFDSGTFGNLARDLDLIRIHRGKYKFFQPKSSGMTPNNTIYLSKGAYLDDFSVSNQMQFFVHEIVHTLQFQEGIDVAGKGALLHTTVGLFTDVYDYKPGKEFAKYNIEQQAQIITHMYIRLVQNPSGSQDAWGHNIPSIGELEQIFGINHHLP